MKKLVSMLLMLLMVVSIVSGCAATATQTTSAATSAPAATKAATASTTAAADTTPIKFAVVGPMTGDYAEYGLAARYAAEMAAKEANAKGGVLGGRKIEIVTYDDRSTTDEASAIAEKIVADKSIVAVVSGHFTSTVALSACPLYQRGGISSQSATSSHPDYVKIGDYVLRNNTTDEAEAKNVVQACFKSGYKKIGVCAEKNDFGVSTSTNMAADAKIINEYSPCEVVKLSYYLTGTVDFSANISELINAGVDCIIHTGTYDAFAPFAMQLRKTGSKVPMFGVGNIYDENLMKVGGAAVEGVRFTSLFNANSTNPKVVTFTKAYKEATGNTPNHVSALVYDSTWAVVNAINQIKSADRTAIKDALHSIKYEGVTGTIIYGKDNECPKPQVIFEVKNGKFEEVPNLISLWDEFIASIKK